MVSDYLLIEEDIKRRGGEGRERSTLSCGV